MTDHDVIVVGGGLVGASLAAALGREGFRVALVEARPAPRPPAPADPVGVRVSALTRAAENVLRAVGAWERIPAARLGPFREMRVWDAGGGGSIHFDSADIGEPALGHIVENRWLQAALEERITALESVTWHRPLAPESIRVGPERVVLSSGGVELTAPLIVGADGSDSRVREMAGIWSVTEDYQHEAVVATVRLSRGHRETAWQRFLPTGPVALLPLPGPRGAVVWSTSPARARELAGASRARFAAALDEALESRFGPLEEIGDRGSFPLRGVRAREYVRERVALVGDAAHTVHPLAGQGVNLGILDAAALSGVLLRSRERGGDPGAYAALRRYERWRKGDNLLTQRVLEGFKWLFGTPLEPVRVSRNLGLSLTDRLGPVKRRIMRRASGLAGDLPPLARGTGHVP